MESKIRVLVQEISMHLNQAGLDWWHVALLLAALALLFGLILVKRSRNYAVGLEQFGGGSARLDKLEVLYNDHKLANARAVEALQGELRYLKLDLEDIKAQLSGRDPSISRAPTLNDIPRPPVQDDETSESKPSSEGSKKKIDLVSVRPSPESTDTANVPSVPSAGLSVVRTAQQKIESKSPKSDVKDGLEKTRTGFFTRLKGLFGAKVNIDAQTIDQVEELLISSDLGVHFTEAMLAAIRQEVDRGVEFGKNELIAFLKNKIGLILHNGPDAQYLSIEENLEEKARANSKPMVIMVVGVNGAGKTTTIGKLANLWKNQGHSVMIAAADTFRAAAVEQLAEWAARSNVKLVRGVENAKPATVVFDAMQKAKDEGSDILIIDTAGRLHTKSNLMAELEGLKNMVQRHNEHGPDETWLVVDGSSGQNALLQAQAFNQATPLSGLIVTKLDGTPKGGIVVAIKDQLKIPIKYIGVGEGINQLRPFVPHEFIEALFDESDSHEQSANLESANANIRRRRVI